MFHWFGRGAATAPETNEPKPLAVQEQQTGGAVSDGKRSIMVFGGSGFIGRRVCEVALQMNVAVTAVSRSGKPRGNVPSDPRITWVQGDIAKVEDSWTQHLAGKTGVVSCVGVFGSQEVMERINGTANANLVKLSNEVGVSNFSYVSAWQYPLVSLFLGGYYRGKTTAENAVQKYYGKEKKGCVVVPAFVYGTKTLSSGTRVPLQLIGKPMEFVLDSFLFRPLAKYVPVLGKFFEAPVSADHVALTMVLGALGELPDAYAGKTALTGADMRAVQQITLKD